jgi:hypothetical protein
MLLYLVSLRIVLYDETNIGYRTTAIRVSFFLVLDYRNNEYRIGKFRLWKSFDSGSDSDSRSGSGSGSRQYFAQFSKYQNYHYFSESWPLIFDLLTFLLHFKLDPDPNSVPETDPKPEL